MSSYWPITGEVPFSAPCILSHALSLIRCMIYELRISLAFPSSSSVFTIRAVRILSRGQFQAYSVSETQISLPLEDHPVFGLIVALCASKCIQVRKALPQTASRVALLRLLCMCMPALCKWRKCLAFIIMDFR